MKCVNVSAVKAESVCGECGDLVPHHVCLSAHATRIGDVSLHLCKGCASDLAYEIMEEALKCRSQLPKQGE